MNPSSRRRDHVFFALPVRDYAIDIRLTHRTSHRGSTDYPCGNYIHAGCERNTVGRDDDAMERDDCARDDGARDDGARDDGDSGTVGPREESAGCGAEQGTAYGSLMWSCCEQTCRQSARK